MHFQHLLLKECTLSNHNEVFVRYHTGGSMKLNAHILHLAYMVYL
jgi:hypothetical protein